MTQRDVDQQDETWGPLDLIASRGALEIGQSELAHLLGVPKSTVWRWENRQRQMPPYLWLAVRGLDCTFNHRDKGMIGTDLIPLYEDEARKNSLSNLKYSGSSSTVSIDTVDGRSTEKAAKAVGVSGNQQAQEGFQNTPENAPTTRLERPRWLESYRGLLCGSGRF